MLQDHEDISDIIQQNGYDETQKLDFSDSGRSIHQYTSTILYDANYVIVFYPKQGIMYKLYSTRGGTRTNCDPLPMMHLEV